MDKLKTIYSQISWREYDQVMEQILYNKFGRLLEEKMGEYEKVKKELKQNVKRIIDDPKALPTPARRPKPAIALTKRINELKELQKTAKKDDQEKEQIERDKKAQKNREDQLKERAERAKKEREERSRRVQKNNQIKEAERKDQEELIRARLAEQKKFTEEQKRHMGTPKCERTPAKLFNNAFRSGTKLITTPTIGVPKPPQTPKAGGTRINDMIPMNIAFGSGTKMIRTSIIGVPMAVPQEKMGEPLLNKTPVKAILTNIKTEEEKNYSAAAEAGSLPKNSFKNVKPNVTAILNDGGSQKEVKEGEKNSIHNSFENDSREHHPQQTSEDEVVEMTELGEPVEISNYDITKEKILIPATEDNYNVDDLSSADETDPEDSPRKQIPKWAQKENLKLHVLSLNCILSAEKIERQFGRIKQPTVLDFFNHTRKKYAKRRSSSATWESPMSDPTPGYGRFQKIFQRS